MTELGPVAERIGQFIRSSLLFGDPAARILEDTPLLTIIDSVGLMHLVTFLEDEFHIAIDDGDVTPENFGSLSAVTSLVEKYAAS